MRTNGIGEITGKARLVPNKADMAQTSSEVTLDNTGEVPKQLVENLKKELPEKLQKAVFANIFDLRNIKEEDCKKVLLKRGFKELKNIRALGENFALKTASGDEQYVNICGSKKGDIDIYQIQLRTTVGNVCSDISYYKEKPLIGGKETIVDNLYKNGKQVRQPLVETLYIK